MSKRKKPQTNAEEPKILSEESKANLTLAVSLLRENAIDAEEDGEEAEAVIYRKGLETLGRIASSQPSSKKSNVS